MYNLDNLVKTYDLDLMNFRCAPKTFVEETKKSFFEKLHPLEWFEKQLYAKPLEVAKAFNIPTVFLLCLWEKTLRLNMEKAKSVRFFILQVMMLQKLYLWVQFIRIRILIHWKYQK